MGFRLWPHGLHSKQNESTVALYSQPARDIERQFSLQPLLRKNTNTDDKMHIHPLVSCICMILNQQHLSVFYVIHHLSLELLAAYG